MSPPIPVSPVTDPEVLSAFSSSQPANPTTDADVIAAFGKQKRGGVEHGGAYFEDPSNPEWQEKFGPLSGTNFAQRMLIGAGSVPSDLTLGGKQISASATGKDPASITDPITGLTAEEKRSIDAPISHTAAGKLGQALGYSPTLFIPGATTLGGATALGTALGALQPTITGESRGVNAAVGGVLGGGSQALGSALGRWAQNRSEEPLMGWNPSTASRAAAESVGSDAPRLTQSALAEAHSRLSDIFGRARSPDISVPIGDATTDTIERLTQGLENDTSRNAFAGNSAVRDLTASLGENRSAETLGQLSSRLGNEARSQMTTQGGDRALGRSLFQLQDHVDDLIGSSIRDPELAAQYAQARPQYRNYMMLTGSAQRLNSVTGEFNATATGKYLQRADPAGYTRGGNTSPLYEAARWGQATGAGKGAPPFTIENLGLPWAAYHAANNPLSNALAGAATRGAAPVLSAVGGGEVAAGASRLAQALALSQKGQGQEPAQKLTQAVQRLMRAEQAQ
jgi:hypothetical protein